MTDLFCDLSVFTTEEREQHLADSETLFGSALAVRDLPDGYAVRLPTNAETLLKAARFIQYDRLCCPFIAFGIEVEPHDSGLWLRLTGGEDLKAAIAGDLAGVLNVAVAAQL